MAKFIKKTAANARKQSSDDDEDKENKEEAAEGKIGKQIGKLARALTSMHH